VKHSEVVQGILGSALVGIYKLLAKEVDFRLIPQHTLKGRGKEYME